MATSTKRRFGSRRNWILNQVDTYPSYSPVSVEYLSKWSPGPTAPIRQSSQ